MGNQGTRYRSIILLLFLPLAFAYCAKSDEVGEGGLIGPEPIDIGQCSQDPNSGSSLNSNSFDPRIKDSGYFIKGLPLDQLNLSLGASTKNITETLKKQGVNVFQVVENSESSCRYFAFLESPSEEALTNWNKNSGSTEGNVLLGLFTTYFSRNKQTGQVILKEPTITVRQDTQKWTMIHELTHFLFAKGRASEKFMPFNEELMGRLKDAQRALRTKKNNYRRHSSRELALEIVDVYQEIFDLAHELDLRGPLEEFAIESMLVEKAQQKLITGINPEEDQRNALAYMLSNSSMVIDSYRDFIRKLSQLRRNLFKEEAPLVKQSIHRIENEIQGHLDFIDEKIANAYSDLSFEQSLAAFPLQFITVSPRQVQHHHFDMNLYKEQQKILSEL